MLPKALRVYSPPWRGGGEADGVVNGSKNTKMRKTENYFSLPFNPKLRERAKALRKAGNLSEVLLWQQLSNRKFKGLDFDRQKIIGNYIVDFYCINCRTVIEIDGSSHDNKQEYDQERDAYLKGLGLSVIHIAAVDVLKRLSDVMVMLEEHPALRQL
ncbi:MAG: DUF559 domain-containing protein [Betaproteobacteria bacterium]|nr:DUF559 domain-containing protein [Betaproteobacteria bacterium]MCL2887148.1 DUF559 domain-containing protein [Betaproteobacteria bacterium]